MTDVATGPWVVTCKVNNQALPPEAFADKEEAIQRVRALTVKNTGKAPENRFLGFHTEGFNGQDSTFDVNLRHFDFVQTWAAILRDVALQKDEAALDAATCAELAAAHYTSLATATANESSNEENEDKAAAKTTAASAASAAEDARAAAFAAAQRSLEEQAAVDVAKLILTT